MQFCRYIDLILYSCDVKDTHVYFSLWMQITINYIDWPLILSFSISTVKLIFSHCKQVSNHTYTCYFPGQELVVRLVANGWLHKGVIVCPACEEVCGDDDSFGGSGDKCKPPSDVPLTVPYHREQLACGGTTTVTVTDATTVTTVTVAALLLLISTWK